MAIYTAFGEEVKIIRFDEYIKVATIQSVNDPKWVRERYAYELKADGGIKEIDEAIAKLLV
jgi:hypothetical protein